MPSKEVGQAILLGIIQGIAEFLPISSSGHLVILQGPLRYWLGISAGATESLHLNVALHLGTLLSILCIYRGELLGLVRRPRLCLAIVWATLPVVVVGFTVKDLIDELFQTPLVAGCSLLVTAGLLVWGQRGEDGRESLETLSPWCSLGIGLFQAVALVPGISRSGSTIAGGLLLGLPRNGAADFSFLIAIPAIAGAATLIASEILQNEAASGSLAAFLAGGLTAFAVGLLALRWLLRLVAQRKLHWFAYYCMLVGITTVAWQILG